MACKLALERARSSMIAVAGSPRVAAKAHLARGNATHLHGSANHLVDLLMQRHARRVVERHAKDCSSSRHGNPSLPLECPRLCTLAIAHCGVFAPKATGPSVGSSFLTDIEAVSDDLPAPCLTSMGVRAESWSVYDAVGANSHTPCSCEKHLESNNLQNSRPILSLSQEA